MLVGHSKMKWTSIVNLCFKFLFIVLLLAPKFAVPVRSQVSVPKPLDWRWHPYGPRADVFLYRVISSYEARLVAFEVDEIDLVGIRAEDIERVRKNRPDAFFIETQSYTCYQILLNMRRWPLADNTFRRALAHTIDREGYVLPEALKGYGLPLYHIIMPALGMWHNPKAKTYEYSLEKANKLLDEAGFEWDAQQKWRIDPKTRTTSRPLGILTGTKSLAPASFTIALHFAEQCERIGIKITHEVVESSTVLMRRLRDTNDFDMCFLGWTGMGPESDWPRLFFHSDYDKPGSWNINGVRNTQLDRLLDGYVFTMNIEEAKSKLWESQVLLQEILPWIPVYSPESITAVSGKYRGLVVAKSPSFLYPLGYHWLSALNEHTEPLPFGAVRRVALATVENLNPATYTWADEAAVVNHIYEYMMLPDPDDVSNSTERMPRLARRTTSEIVEVKPGVNGMKITFDLVTNATWHDGIRFTAYDMNYTVWELGKKHKLYRYLDEWIQNAYKTEIPNDHTFIVYVDALSWLHQLYAEGFRPMPKHIWEKMKDPKRLDPAREKHPTYPELTLLTGTGPVVLRDYKPGNYIASMWNPAYFLRHPDKGLTIKISKLSTTVYDDESFEIVISVLDYAGRVVGNATATLQFKANTKIEKEISLKHVGNGVYSGTVPSLAAATYKATIRAVQDLPFGVIARTQNSSLIVQPALMRYVPYVVIIVVVGGAVVAIVFYRKQITLPRT